MEVVNGMLVWFDPKVRLRILISHADDVCVALRKGLAGRDMSVQPSHCGIPNERERARARAQTASKLYIALGPRSADKLPMNSNNHF